MNYDIPTQAGFELEGEDSRGLGLSVLVRRVCARLCEDAERQTPEAHAWTWIERDWNPISPAFEQGEPVLPCSAAAVIAATATYLALTDRLCVLNGVPFDREVVCRWNMESHSTNTWWELSTDTHVVVFRDPSMQPTPREWHPDTRFRLVRGLAGFNNREWRKALNACMVDTLASLGGNL